MNMRVDNRLYGVNWYSHLQSPENGNDAKHRLLAFLTLDLAVKSFITSRCCIPSKTQVPNIERLIKFTCTGDCVVLCQR